MDILLEEGSVQGSRTIQQYRAIDLSLFAIILIVFENVIVRAASGMFAREPWTVSVTAAVTAIVMVRWGPWAAIHAVLGGIVYVLVSRGGFSQYAIYAIGNTAALALLPLLRKWGWERLHSRWAINMLYGFLVLLAMQMGRGIIAVILGAAPATAAGFITTDVLTYVFTTVIVWIASRLDGMLEDQDHYLRRINDPKNREGGIG